MLLNLILRIPHQQGYVQFATVICYTTYTAAAIPEACRLSKLAISTIKNDHRCIDILPRVYFIYYAFVAPLTEPLQSCVDNLRRGFECGIASGDLSYGEMK